MAQLGKADALRAQRLCGHKNLTLVMAGTAAWRRHVLHDNMRSPFRTTTRTSTISWTKNRT